MSDQGATSTASTSIVIGSMKAEDVEQCGVMIFEAFDYVMQHFIVDSVQCTPEARIQYRKEYLRYEAASGSTCQIARDEADSGRVIGLAVWKNVNVQTTSRQQISLPDKPRGLDADRWRTFVAKEGQYAADAIHDQLYKELLFLVVDKNYRRCKLGSRLLQQYLEGDEQMPRYLVSTAAATAFYESLGFCVTDKGRDDGGLKISGNSTPIDVIWPMVRHPRQSSLSK